MRRGLLERFFRGNENNIKRNCFMWNSIAGAVNAAEAVVLMMIITRTNGLDSAGILSIAFAIGNLMMTIGKFGVRYYQVSDVKKEYSFNSYFTLRLITTILMILCSSCYIIVNALRGNYSSDKVIVIAGICFIYVIEAFEDVFLGYYQEEGRLDIASKVFIVRWIVIMIIFTVISVAIKNLVLAVSAVAGISFIIELFLIAFTKKIVSVPAIHIDMSRVKYLLKQCLSLFLVAFLTYYVTNAPKYAIDRFLSEDIQAYYGYISMPVFVVELLNCFLYQPQIVGLAEDWNNKKFKAFRDKEKRQFLIILGLTIICVTGAYLFGIPVLSVIYGTDLIAYRKELVILMFAGGALAFVGYTSVLLTVMRKQRLLLYNMVIISVFAVLGFGKTVQFHGMTGVAVYYLVLMVVLAFLNYCCTIAVEIKYKKSRR